MNNLYRMSFCKICKKKALDDNQKLHCGLTKTAPVFENKCSFYEFDKSERERLIKIRRISHQRQSKETEDKLVRFFKRRHHVTISETSNINFNSDFESNHLPEFFEFKNALSNKTFILLAIFIIAIIMSIAYAFNVMNSDDIINIISIVTLIVFAIYILNPLKLIRSETGKTRIILSVNGLIIENQIINWQEILLTSIKTVQLRNSTHRYLLVSRIWPKEDVQYNIDNLEIPFQKLSYLIEIFKKRYWNKTLPTKT